MRPKATTPGAPATDYRLFEELYPKLRRFAAVVADRDIEPDDLVQDALAATIARHQLHELDQPAAYLKRAILNAATSHRRRAGRFRRLVPRLVGDGATVDAYPSDLAVLDSLDPTDRAVLYLADVEGVPHPIVAEELRLTPAAVRKRASRSRNRLRRQLQTENHAHSTRGPEER